MDGLRVGAGIFNYHLKQKLAGGLQPAEYIRGISNAYMVNKIGSIWMASSPDFSFEFNERTGEFRLQVIGKATWRGKAGFTRKNPEENVLEISWHEHLYCSEPQGQWQIWDGTRIIMGVPKECMV